MIAPTYSDGRPVRGGNGVCTTYALAVLRSTEIPLCEPDMRAFLLAAAALADEALFAPDGYSGHTIEEVAALLIEHPEDSVRQWVEGSWVWTAGEALRGLGVLSEVVSSAGRERRFIFPARALNPHLSGEELSQR